MKGFRLRILGMLAVFLLSVAAQAQNAKIFGTVTDQKGAAVVGAEVTVVNLATGNKLVTKTGSDGSYDAAPLPAGNYSITVNAKGFASSTSDSIKLAYGQAFVREVKLKVGKASESVSVYGKIQGGADTGYRMDTTKATSVWGDRSIDDTPYTEFSASSDLVQNYMAGNIDQIFKMNPLVGAIYDYNTFNRAEPELRGQQVNANYINGVPTGAYLGTFTELFDSIDVYSGLTGFLYGAGNTGGFVNYNMKHYTPGFKNSISAGSYGDTSFFGAADVGGAIWNGKLGYRLNVAAQDGGTGVHNQKVSKWVVGGTADFHVTDNLTLTLDTYAGDRDVQGRQFMFNLGALTTPLDGSQLYTPKNSFDEVKSKYLDAGAKYKLGKYFSYRGIFQHKIDYNPMFYPLVCQITTSMSCDMEVAGNVMNFASSGGYSYVDSHFKTVGVQHNLTFGTNGYHQKNSSGLFNGENIISYTGVAAPVPLTTLYGLYNNQTVAGTPVNEVITGAIGDTTWTDPFQYYTGILSKSSVVRYVNTMIGDDIRFKKWVSLLIGENHASITSISFNAAGSYNSTGVQTVAPGTLTSSYGKAAWTPTYSVMIKPVSWLMGYTTYMETLQAGPIVGATYTNALQVMPPTRSKEIEGGLKANVKNVRLTADYFVSRNASYQSSDGTTTGTYEQQATQIARGVEYTAQGKVLPHLTILGGGTHCTYKYTHRTGSNATMNGEEPDETPTTTAKVSAEYEMPYFRGWVMTGGAYYEGMQYGDANYLTPISGFTLVDLGSRYSRKIHGEDTTFRINATNVGNIRYWPASRTPGAPRVVAFSGTIHF